MVQDVRRPGSFRKLRPILWVGLGVALCTALFITVAVTRWQAEHVLRHSLLTMPPDEVAADPALVRVASADAAPVYAAQCASCHGANLQGRVDMGAPSLSGRHWLYGAGRVSDIERTILFGIRAGNGKSRNVAEMPALGQTGILQPAEIRSVVSYLLSFKSAGQNAGAVADGRSVYLGKGGCSECHGADAHGSSDLGAPNLVAGAWSHGGSAAELYQSLFLGRHGVCPAWYGVLSFSQIRALAVYIYAASHGSEASAGVTGGAS